MQNLILTPVSVEELVNLIASEVETRIHKTEVREPLPERMTLQEACDLTDQSKGQIYKMTMLGTIPCSHFGKRLIFSRKALTEWMDERTISSHSDRDEMSDRLSETAKKRLAK